MKRVFREIQESYDRDSLSRNLEFRKYFLNFPSSFHDVYRSP